MREDFMPTDTSKEKKDSSDDTISATIKFPDDSTNIAESSPISGEPIKIKMLYEIVVGIVVVLFLGFAAMFVATATMLIDEWRSDKSAQNDLENKILEQNIKIDMLLVELKQNVKTKK